MPSLTTTAPADGDGDGPIPEPVLWRWVLDQRNDQDAAPPAALSTAARRTLDPVHLVRQLPTVHLDAAPRAHARPTSPEEVVGDCRAEAAQVSAPDDGRNEQPDDAGQATAEYALVLLGAAAIALLVVSWATKTNIVGRLLDVIFDQLIGHATGGGGQ